MKDTITIWQFRDAMVNDRFGFSYEGATALFDYLTEYEGDTGEELDFDPIAFSCEWTEYENLEEALNDYSDDYKTIDDLSDTTQVIEIPNTKRLIIQEF